MPELPEVETIKNQLEKTLKGKTIAAVFVYLDKMIKVGSGKISSIKVGSTAETKKFTSALKNKKILSIERRAKYLVINLSGGGALIIHLRMSGQILVIPKKDLQNPVLLSMAKKAEKQLLPYKHTHIEFLLKDGSKLFYNDIRQFGHMRLVSIAEKQTVLETQNLGPEPLTISLKEFAGLIKKYPNRKIKDFLLDQGVIAGIGNIYADESLYAAKIKPARKAATLKKHETKALHTSIKKILTKAIKAGGSSLENFIAVNGDSGKFATQHNVYGRAGKPCKNCGKPLATQKIGSRTTVFCRNCQI